MYELVDLPKFNFIFFTNTLQIKCKQINNGFYAFYLYFSSVFIMLTLSMYTRLLFAFINLCEFNVGLFKYLEKCWVCFI